MLVGIGGKKGGHGGKKHGSHGAGACCGGAPGPCNCGGKGGKGPKGPKGRKGPKGAMSPLGAMGLGALEHLGGIGKKVRGAKLLGRVKGLRSNGLGGIEGLAGLAGLSDNALLDAGERGTFLGLGDEYSYDSEMMEGFEGLGDLGDTLDTSAFVLTADQVMRAADTFDVQLNSWLLDYAKAAAKLPPALVTQVDAYVFRWREVKNSWYIFETVRIKDMVNAMAEWNGLRDTVASYGVKSIVGPATVSVNGLKVAADKIPYTPDFLTQMASYAKWAGFAVGGLVLLKVAGDLGVTKQISGLMWDWSDKKHKRARAEAGPATVG